MTAGTCVWRTVVQTSGETRDGIRSRSSWRSALRLAQATCPVAGSRPRIRGGRGREQRSGDNQPSTSWLLAHEQNVEMFPEYEAHAFARTNLRLLSAMTGSLCISLGRCSSIWPSIGQRSWCPTVSVVTPVVGYFLIGSVRYTTCTVRAFMARLAAMGSNKRFCAEPLRPSYGLAVAGSALSMWRLCSHQGCQARFALYGFLHLVDNWTDE